MIFKYCLACVVPCRTRIPEIFTISNASGGDPVPHDPSPYSNSEDILNVSWKYVFTRSQVIRVTHYSKGVEIISSEGNIAKPQNRVRRQCSRTKNFLRNPRVMTLQRRYMKPQCSRKSRQNASAGSTSSRMITFDGDFPGQWDIKRLS